MKKIEDPLQTQVVHSGTLSQKTGLKEKRKKDRFKVAGYTL